MPFFCHKYGIILGFKTCHNICPKDYEIIVLTKRQAIYPISEFVNDTKYSFQGFQVTPCLLKY